MIFLLRQVTATPSMRTFARTMTPVEDSHASAELPRSGDGRWPYRGLFLD